MRYWYDTEFIDDGKTIDLLSVGIVAEDGRELSLQSCECDLEKASSWVRENVLPHLEICRWAAVTLDSRSPWRNDSHYHKRHGQCVDQHRGWIHNCPWRTREQIRWDIVTFLNVETYGKPELWGYYSAYDHVAFAQLFGAMIDLPEGYPMYTNDIKQWCQALGNPRLPEQGKGEHNALADARWNKVAWEFLHTMEGGAS